MNTDNSPVPFFDVYERMYAQVKPVPVAGELRGLATVQRHPMDPTGELPLDRYADAFEGFHILVWGCHYATHNYIMFQIPGGKILRITSDQLQNFAYRPFDLPILERGTRDAGTGLILEWQVQPRPVLLTMHPDYQREAKAFREMVEAQGYYFTYGRQSATLGMYDGKVYVMDPCHVRGQASNQ